MQREEADPAGGMDCVLMRVIAVLGDFVRHVVDRDDPVEERDEYKDEEPQGEIIEERIEVDATSNSSVIPTRRTAIAATAATTHFLNQKWTSPESRTRSRDFRR